MIFINLNVNIRINMKDTSNFFDTNSDNESNLHSFNLKNI